VTTAPTSTAGSRARPVSPYKGLASFEDSELDALLFFGRERDREIIGANLVAARLTILYGPSGVGKSSVLRAGVARDLRALPERPAVVVHDVWTTDPLDALDEAVARESGVQPTGSVIDTIALAAALRGEVFLVLDQIEEYFLYHAPQRGPGTFETTLAEIVLRPELAVHVLIGVREDALARLDAFKSRIPGLFTNSLRLERLDREAGRRAIVGPVGRFGALVPEEEGLAIEDELVDAVLDGVRAGELVQGAKGRGAKHREAVRIETPYLQLVMQRLWEVERAAGSRVLRLATLERLGGAGRIVEDHLERALAALTQRQKAMAARMFDHLVTPSGTKIAHGSGDLALYAAASLQEVDPVIQALGRERILRTIRAADGGAHEIYHDVLADAVLAWRARFEAEQALAQERAEAERRHRRLLALVGASAVALAAMAGITIYALTQRSNAQHQALVAFAERQSAVKAQKQEQTAKTLAVSQRKRAEKQARIARQKTKVAKAAQTKAQTSEKQAQQSEQQAEASKTQADQSAQEAQTAQQSAQDSADTAVAAQQQAEASARTATHEKTIAVRNGNRAKRNAKTARAATKQAKASAKRARREARHAHGRELAARALALIPTDPAQAVLHALEAAVYEPTDRTEGVLRAAIQQLRVLAVLPGGGGPVRSLDLSPDGTFFVTGSERGGARIFDVRTGRLLRVFGDGGGASSFAAGSAARAVSVAISPDGRLVAAGGSGSVALVWNRETGKLLWTLRHGGGVRTVAFSPDSRKLVTASADATARVFDLVGGAPPLILQHSQPVKSAQFSPDGRFVLTVGGEPNAARVFDAATGAPVASLTHPGEVTTATFSRDSRLVATGGRRNVRLWSTGDWQMTRELTGHSFTINQVAFSPTGDRVASASSDGTARVWRTDTGEFVDLIAGHDSPVETVEFSPNGQGIATGSTDKHARFEIGPPGNPSIVFSGHGDTVSGLKFTPDGKKLITISGDGDARIWTTRFDEQLRLLGRQTGALSKVAYTPDGRLVLSAGADGTARLRTPGGQLVRSFDEGAPIVAAQLSHSGALLLTAGADGTARLWNARTGASERTFAHGAAILAAALSSDGDRVATAGADGKLRLWDAATGRLVGERGHGGPVTAVAFSRDGKLLATGADDSLVRVFRAVDGRPVRTLRGQTGSIASLDFSPNDKRIASAGAGSDTTARVWDLSGGPALALVGHDAPLTTIRWSPDGRFLVTAGGDGDVRTWRASDGRQLQVLRGHVAVVADVAYSPDGRWIATAGPGAAALWRSSTGNRLFYLRGHQGALRSIAFAPRGESLVTGGVDGTVRTYTCSICGNLDQLRAIARAKLKSLRLASEAARGPR
jgi:WD40 repeat protein/outer membrane biosynthesis protein TonB